MAPACNIKCNYCDRKYDCVNESRPGVSSTILSPAQALHYLKGVSEKSPNIAVVGIAGTTETGNIDPLEQIYTRQVRLEKWVSGEMVASEEYTLRENIYFKNEVLLMLEVAGFREIGVYGDYSDEIATADHEELNFTAIK